MVASYLSTPMYLVTSNQQMLYAAMGDRVGTAILKALYGRETIDDLTVTKIRQLASNAFANLRMVKYESERLPAVTLCMLEWLIAKRPDCEEEIRGDIRKIRDAYNQRSAELGIT